jgi:RNA polymerase sigma-70 factor (ECF subfamily)
VPAPTTMGATNRSYSSTSSASNAWAALVERALKLGRPGRYQLEAAIAAVHDQARRAVDTDWREIAQLYRQLMQVAPSPVVELNRAVAVAMAEGPDRGLDIVLRLEAGRKLVGYHLLYATKAHLLERLGRRAAAAASYTRALELTTNEVERAHLSGRLERLREGDEP